MGKREREAGGMDEERIDIARRFLVASPPGEVGNVARDVRALLGGDALLSDARAQSIFRELNLKHFTAVDMPNGSKALLTPYGEVSSALSQGEEGGMCRHYLEPESGTIIEVDHVKQTCIGQRDAEEGEATSDAARALRSGISMRLRDYVAETYPGGAGAVYASMKEGGDKEIAVCISSLKVSPRNFWTGSWKSESTVRVKTAARVATMKYAISVLVHYFEEGNVQLTTSTSGQVDIPVSGGDAELADAIVAELRRVEKQYLMSLEDSFGDLSETFKELRRKLPLTQSHFPWQNSESFLASELNSLKMK